VKIVVSHPTGNEFSKAAIEGFAKADILQSYYTALASFPGNIAYKLGSVKWFADIRRRSFDRHFKPFVHTRPWKEAARLIAIKIRAKKLTEHEQGIFSVDKVYADLDAHVAKKLEHEKRRGVTAIYAYEDGAYYSFQKAKKLNIKCAYDLPIGYWRAMHEILGKERESNPAWGSTLEGLKDSKEKLNRKDDELRLSDKIFVASSFTAKTLEAYPHKLPQVYIIPYGFPAVRPKSYRLVTSSEKIKLLFVGGLSQRKGLSYLFKAMEGFENHFSLTVVGRLTSK
jgi:glycosyltransferase involved in cell wall biosynthesis